MIKVEIEDLLAQRRMNMPELAKKVGVTEEKLIRFCEQRLVNMRISILDGVCRELNCQPEDLLKFSAAEDKKKTKAKNVKEHKR